MSHHRWEGGDYANSDDMDDILSYTQQVHERLEIPSSSRKQPIKHPSRPPSPDIEVNDLDEYRNSGPKIRGRIEELDAEVLGCRADIELIQNRIQECLKEKQKLARLLDLPQANRNRTTMDAKGKGKAVPQSRMNYLQGNFDWTNGLKARMKSVFGIKEFRLCQEGVCNANMDGRDIVCIMPTGGGKSLTYQLPALLMTGCTLVISPLISLMTDQILHLREAGVSAAMITSSTKEAEKKKTLQRLHMLAEQRISPDEKEIKLIYVTPERISKDKSFRSLLQKVDNANKLARIVLDEAHCVSQLGHDFRKDYKELHILRKIFPRVPIMGLSATCGPHVLKDLISILGLKEVVPGEDAPSQGTVLFTSPLYRKNLHYRVVPKPDSSKDQLDAMKTYILENHPNQTGIIYCLSKKDTESVAEQLRTRSEGRIETGVYHADVNPREKERLHEAWREGKIKVVCATIAFGMGIDKGDVRFVLHHSISKSLEGYYQESGRAGRDGLDSDCILYYRPQDASTLATMAARDKNGEEKLHAVLNYAEELRRCRKVQFAEYFSHSSDLSVASWSTVETGALDRCGHCDNCKRDEGSVERRDVTLAAWRLLKILQAVRQQGGKLTLGKLAALARGNAKGAYEVTTMKGRKRETESLTIDLASVAGGAVEMSKLDIEHLLIKLTMQHFFQEEYQQTSYNINVYIAPGAMAARLNYLSCQSVIDGKANLKLEVDFLKPKTKTKSRETKKLKQAEASGTKSMVPKKRKTESEPNDFDDMYEPDNKVEPIDLIDTDDDEEGEEFDWSFNMREELQHRSTKRPRYEGESSQRKHRKSHSQESDPEILVLSSD